MVIRLGRNGRFLACSKYPEHKETRPLPGEEPRGGRDRGRRRDVPASAARARWSRERGRFGPFAGCSRYPDCKYIRKTGPPPPEPLPFEVDVPQVRRGHSWRRAERDGPARSSTAARAIPKCDFTSSREPIGALHDADDGPVAREGESGGICLKCGAPVELPEVVIPGVKLAGGDPNPEALVPARRGGGGRRVAARARAERRPTAARRPRELLEHGRGVNDRLAHGES